MSRFKVKLVPVPTRHHIKRDYAPVDSDNCRPTTDESDDTYHDYRLYVCHSLVRSQSDGRAPADALNLLALVLGRGAAILALGAIRISAKAFRSARDMSERRFTTYLASKSVMDDTERKQQPFACGSLSPPTRRFQR